MPQIPVKITIEATVTSEESRTLLLDAVHDTLASHDGEATISVDAAEDAEEA